MPDRLRWLTIATVIVSALATLSAAGAFLFTLPLILGLVAEKWAHRRGRWLMWVGAAYLSVTVLQMEVLILPEAITELRTYHHLGGLGPVLLPLWTVSILLIVFCDVALAIDAVKRRERRAAANAADSIVWMSALLFSVYAFWDTRLLLRAHQHGLNDPDILATNSAVIVIAALFDAALLADAANLLRVR